jgi:integrase
MPPERERFQILPGISIFREYRTWMLDLAVDRKRVRRSLATRDQLDAAETAIRIARLYRDTPQRAVPGGPMDLVRHAAPPMNAIAADTLAPAGSGFANKAEVHHFGPALETYLSAIQVGREDNSKDWRMTVEAQIRSFFRHAKIATIEEVTNDRIEDWLAYERTGDPARGKRPSGHWSLRHKFYSISKFLRFASRRGWTPWQPHEDLVPRRPTISFPRFCLTSEIRRILAAAKRESRELGLACAVAAFSGLRRGEIFNLDWRDVNLADRRIEIPESKTGKARWAPILDGLVVYFPKPKVSGKLFLRWGHVDTLGKQADEVIKKALGRDEKGIGLNILRHSCSTHFQANGVAASIVADWLGHRVSTAERHYRGRFPVGEKPLTMTFRGRSLEKYGIPEVRGRR